MQKLVQKVPYGTNIMSEIAFRFSCMADEQNRAICVGLQVFVTSEDGADVPMLIMHKKGLQLSGNNPTLLECHSGINENILPQFSLSKVCFVLGYNGVYASTFISRSRQEENKFRTEVVNRCQAEFSDLNACALYLLEAQYTSPDKLAVEGSAHGGFVVCSCALQKPDLFGCVLAKDATLDMLRFHTFAFGSILKDFYGNPGDPKDFLSLYKVSPLHNVQVTVGYSISISDLSITAYLAQALRSFTHCKCIKV